MSPSPSSIPRFLTLGLSCVLLLAACAAPESRTPRTSAPEQPAPQQGSRASRKAGEQAAVVAVRQIGAPYRYGGNNASGFDCSGLVQFAYAAAGKSLPRTTRDLWRQMQPVRGELEVGDVLFFNIEGKVSHVGLYLGSRRFVHAPASGREVTIADLDSDFYRRAFIRGGRPR